jgi:hypothetical protein
MSSRVAQANAAVEDELDTYSDEVDEEDVDDTNGEELDTTGRLGQPLSYNRSLMELYRDFRCPLL